MLAWLLLSSFSFLSSSSRVVRKRFYLQRSSGQAVITGVFLPFSHGVMRVFQFYRAKGSALLLFSLFVLNTAVDHTANLLRRVFRAYLPSA